MPQGSTTFHESEERLSPATRDMHRAIVSLMEELEAVDWYQQRMDATESAELRDILRHNRDEEKEHAAMVLEWIRRHDPSFDTKLREYLFTEGSIVGREAVLEQQASGAPASAGAPATNGRVAARASVGSLRGGR
jgi:ferritin-like protein